MQQTDRQLHRNPFLESERIFIELSSLAPGRQSFLQAVSNQFRLLSGCAAIEIRAFDADLHYRWYTNFESTPQYDDVEYIRDGKAGWLPVLKTVSTLEEVCRDVFTRRFDPLLQYEYNLNSRYIEDTAQKIFIRSGADKREISLAGTGFGSLLLLPFTVPDNPPGLLILYGKAKRFIDNAVLPDYEDLMGSFSIALKFRRALYALNERIKELSCLYEINQIFQDGMDEPDTLLHKIVEHIPQAFQYPEAASAKLQLGKAEYLSANCVPASNRLKSDILLAEQVVGTLSVYYPEHRAGTEPMHFLPEEQQLLDIIAQKVSLIHEKIAHERDKQAMEEQLRHADRLATIGQLGSGIAHELNDPLANILGYAQLLLKTVKDPAQQADLERIVRSSLQAREIVRKLLLFARQMPTQMQDVSLNKVVADTLDLLTSRLEQGRIRLTLELGDNLPELKADSSQLTQMVTNLCVNALQAMPQGGKLNVSTQFKDDKVILEVSDTGTGISKADLEKIFLPFYTTKPVGVGTGLGLSVVHGIIDSHRGSIKVSSKPGKGSKFTVILPVQNISADKDKQL